MAIDANAVSLAQWAIMSNDPLVQAITFSLLDNGTVLDDIPFLNKATLVANGVRWEGDLPTVTWANVNEEGGVTKGTPHPFQEQAYIIRNKIDVDKYLVLDQNQIVDPRAAQVAAYLKAVAYDFNDKFINNAHDGTGNSKSIVGLRARIAASTSATNQPYGVRYGNAIDAGGVDMRQANMTAATANAFLEWLSQLLWSVGAPDGTGVILYMNEVMQRRFEFALRLLGTNGGLSTTQDQFGRTILMYKGAKIRDIGYKADQTTRIITTTEAATGLPGSSVYTSIYAVRYSTDAVFGWQFAPFGVQDMGLLPDGAIYRTNLDWAGGLYNNSLWGMARLFDIKLA